MMFKRGVVYMGRRKRKTIGFGSLLFLPFTLLSTSMKISFGCCKGLMALFNMMDCSTSSFTPNQLCNVNNMSGLEFEHYCAQELRSLGFQNVNVTPASGDYGADITAIDSYGKKWVFQCKRYNQALGNSPIQEVFASKNHYRASEACVITNSCFTENAKILAKENHVYLIEYCNFLNLRH